MDVKTMVVKIRGEIVHMSAKLDRLQETLDSIVAGDTVRVLNVWDEKPGLVISRDDARVWGIERYNTGEKCANGHKAWRYVSNGCCVVCLATRAAMIKRARSRGDVFKGDPCEKGHVGWRHKEGGGCVECDEGRRADGRLVMGGVPGVSSVKTAKPVESGRRADGRLIMGGVPGGGR